jgi:hypothetical protein
MILFYRIIDRLWLLMILRLYLQKNSAKLVQQNLMQTINKNGIMRLKTFWPLKWLMT